MAEAVTSDDSAEGPMHFTSPWNSSFSFSGIRSCPIACKKSKKKKSRKQLAEKNPIKHGIHNRSLQAKPLSHEPHSMLEKFPSPDEVACLGILHSGRAETKAQHCTTPPASGCTCTGEFHCEQQQKSKCQLCIQWSPCIIINTELLLGMSQQGKQGEKFLFPSFPTLRYPVCYCPLMDAISPVCTPAVAWLSLT